MFELAYVGIGYPSRAEIEARGKAKGAKYSYWASEVGFDASYNGDTLVMYDALDSVPAQFKADAIKYGEVIKLR